MADNETAAAGTAGDQPEPQVSDASKPSTEESKPAGHSLRIWPPTQRTRFAVVNRLIETLSTPSVLSNRYGTISTEEASAAARSIEEEAYGVASASVKTEDDGIEILQLYSKEISKRMLDSMKARTASGNAGNKSAGEQEAEKDEKPNDASEEPAEEPSESVKTDA